MKKRLKNLITSIFGILIWLFAGFLFYIGKVEIMSFSLLLGLGYIFLVAKDSLLEGLTWRLFKPKE